jgi:hypothetical protein
MTLAREMAAAVEAGDEEREELEGVALAVGQWLAEEGRPGRWDTLVPAEVLRAMGLPSRRENDGFLHSLPGWWGTPPWQGDIDEAAARRSSCRSRRWPTAPRWRRLPAASRGRCGATRPLSPSRSTPFDTTGYGP